MSLPMATWHNKAHSNDNYSVNTYNVTEEEKKHLIVALLLIIISMQLNILQQQRMMMMVNFVSPFIWFCYSRCQYIWEDSKTRVNNYKE